jgi:hypothetical protein
VLSSDQFHPSLAGYTAWADVIFDALVTGPEVLAEAAPTREEPAGA